MLSHFCIPSQPDPCYLIPMSPSPGSYGCTRRNTTDIGDFLDIKYNVTPLPLPSHSACTMYTHTHTHTHSPSPPTSSYFTSISPFSHFFLLIPFLLHHPSLLLTWGWYLGRTPPAHWGILSGLEKVDGLVRLHHN